MKRLTSSKVIFCGSGELEKLFYGVLFLFFSGLIKSISLYLIKK
jgi:hypothetical protein